MEIRFQAQEYQADGRFRRADYEYRGSPEQGWEVLRQGACVLRLGPGYEPVESLLCGICATDLARRHLPFPLPQITGHEVVGRHGGRRVVVEINASHRARGVTPLRCLYCEQGLDSHCPQRLTLGIDRLPGGFAPWLLAPRAGIHALGEEVSDEAAMLVEPLAAVLQAVHLDPPRPGERVAVLGPRRLGLLLLAALVDYRERQGLDFHLSALARHKDLRRASRRLGADEALDPGGLAARPCYDHVFDTTGSPSGLALALLLSRARVHLKSTHGQPCFGLHQLTRLVIDEITLLPALPPELAAGAEQAVYCSPALARSLSRELAGQRVYSGELAAAGDWLRRNGQAIPLGRFDVAIVADLAQADALLRAGLLRPRGHLVCLPGDEAGPGNPLRHALVRGVTVTSSRCGSFPEAIAMLRRRPDLAQALVAELVTHRFAAGAIEQAFALAADSRRARKVAIYHTALPRG